MKQYSRVCERVDLDAIFYNFQMMKANIKDGVQMIAVIKTDGYGHGAVQIARLLEPVDYIWGYAVATLDEAVVLRKNEIKKPEEITQITDIKKTAESMNLSFQGSLSAAFPFQQAITENR